MYTHSESHQRIYIFHTQIKIAKIRNYAISNRTATGKYSWYTNIFAIRVSLFYSFQRLDYYAPSTHERAHSILIMRNNYSANAFACLSDDGL